ncbi:MAG: TIGR02147 family protein [Myxococcales bacterium]|nr:MAG: TIGR02147 family protein [Myxococcales bacterium]
MKRTKLDIFGYADYRRLIADRLDELKAENSRLSRRYFIRKLGLSSANYFKRLIEGERKLSDDLARRLAETLGFGEAEAAFFLDLVRFGQAKSTPEKAEALELLRRRRRFLRVNQLELDRFDYFTDPLALVLRGLVDLKGFKEDPAWIAARLPFRTTPKKIRETLDRLLKEGHLERSPEGRLTPAHQHEDAGDRLGNLHLRRYHLLMLELAGKAMELPPETRLFSGLSMSIPLEAYCEITKELAECRERIRQIVDRHADTEAVYHLEMTFFPLTKPAGLSRKPKADKEAKR